MIALSVAAVLAVFLLYTSIAGGGTPAIAPSELDGRTDKVSLGGKVVGPSAGDAREGGLRFRLRDIKGGYRRRSPFCTGAPSRTSSSSTAISAWKARCGTAFSSATPAA